MKIQVLEIIKQIRQSKGPMSDIQALYVNNLEDCMNSVTYRPTRGQLDSLTLILVKTSKKVSKKGKKQSKLLENVRKSD